MMKFNESTNHHKVFGFSCYCVKLLQICNFALLETLVTICGPGAIYRSSDIVQSAILCSVLIYVFFFS